MNFNSNHRNELILITDISPDLSGSGSQHLKDIIRYLTEYSRLRIVQLNTASIDYHRSKPPPLDNDVLQVTSDLQHVTLQTLFESTSMGDAEQTAYLHRIRINAYKFFDKFNREMNSVKAHSTVVIFVQWPGMIFLWEAFASSKWRTVPILMDRYEPLFIAYALAKSSQALIRDSFDAALSQSAGLLTGSKKAAQELAKTLQVPCREIMSVFRKTSASKVVGGEYGLTNLRRLKISKKPLIEIALAGQIYARDTVEIFLTALERLNALSHGDGCKYSFNYFGDYPIRGMYNHNCIVAHGSFEYKELMASMGASCSFGLVPYSFETSFSTSAAFSFPSKLVAYIQAGLIPIYIGPRESSVFYLFEEYDLAGLCITSENPLLIGQQLVNIISNDLNAVQVKLFALADVFKPEYLQHCINNVFDQIS